MRLYASKSSAIRAAKKAGLSTGEYEIIKKAGKFGFRAIKADEVEEQVPEEEAAPKRSPRRKQPKKEATSKEQSTKKEVVMLRKSTIESPSKRVWEIAEQMKAANPNVRRKDVIAACVEQGIAYYTARTQYQLWFKANRAS